MPRQAFSTKWINENMIDGEMSDADFEQAVIKCMQDRVKKEEENKEEVEKKKQEGVILEITPGGVLNYGNDGIIEVYRERRIHWGIPYELAVMRYFVVRRLPDNQFELIDLELPSGMKGLNRLGKHVVVEGERLPHNLRELLGLDEFLYHDTLHFWQQDWSLKQQWDYAEKLAIQDCERLGPNLIVRLKMGGFLEAIVICGKNLKSFISRYFRRKLDREVV